MSQNDALHVVDCKGTLLAVLRSRQKFGRVQRPAARLQPLLIVPCLFTVTVTHERRAVHVLNGHLRCKQSRLGFDQTQFARSGIMYDLPAPERDETQGGSAGA